MKQDYFRAVWTSAVAISRRVFTALFLLAALSSCQIPVLGQPGQDPLFGQDLSLGLFDNPYEFSASYEVNPKTHKGRVFCSRPSP